MRGLFTSRQLTNEQIRNYIGGAGIAFPATQAPSANPNTLDDYEEGTVTLLISDGTNIQANIINECSYVKIGRLVFIQCHWTWGAWTATAAAGVRITGLPFAIGTLDASINATEAAMIVGSFNGFNTAATENQIAAFIVAALSTTAIWFARMNDNAAGDFVLGNEMTGNGGLSLGIIYVANS